MESKLLDELIDRASQKRSMPLRDFLISENLDTYEPGYIDILYADELNNAIVPCRGYMILARERWSVEDNSIVAEYAIYTQHDHDGHPLQNSLNYNATYKLEYVAEESFENMAFAIVHAACIIKQITENERRN